MKIIKKEDKSENHTELSFTSTTIVPTIEWKWISTKDQLPEYDQHILIYGRQYGVYQIVCGVYYLCIREQPTRGKFVSDEGDGFSEVTHWMPLPEPPKDKR